MQHFWLFIGGIALLVLVAAATSVYRRVRALREERRFNEFFVCVVLYELGDDSESSMPLGILRRILPCHPDEADEMLAYLELKKLIEIYLDDNASRVRLGVRPYMLMETGNWRRAFSPALQRRFAAALAEAKRKSIAEFGALPA